MLSRYIALDIGEVCIDLRMDRVMSYFGITTLPPSFLETIDNFERGRIGESEILEQIRSQLPRMMSDAEIRHGWNLILGDEKPGTARLVREGLRLGYRFAFFSDTSPTHFLHTVAFLSFAHLVDGRVVSYEVGAKKPEAAMFDAFERAYGTPILYFDDKPENIAAARERHGWNAHVFTSPDDALRILTDYHSVRIPVLDMEDDDFEG